MSRRWCKLPEVAGGDDFAFGRCLRGALHVEAALDREEALVVFCRTLAVRPQALVFQTAHVDGGEEFDQRKTEGRRTRQL